MIELKLNLTQLCTILEISKYDLKFANNILKDFGKYLCEIINRFDKLSCVIVHFSRSGQITKRDEPIQCIKWYLYAYYF